MIPQSEMARGTILHVWSDIADYQLLADWADFLWIRSGDGTSQDGKVQQHYDNLKDKDVDLGFYHIFRDNKSDTAQVAAFINIVKQVTGGILPGLLNWDVETDGGMSNTTARERLQTVLYHTWWEFLIWPSIYTSEYFYELLLNVSSNPPSWSEDVDLWVADYSQWPPRLPDGFLRPHFVQVGETLAVPGMNSLVTEDYFVGTPNDLKAYIAKKRGLALDATDPNDLAIKVAEMDSLLSAIKTWGRAFPPT